MALCWDYALEQYFKPNCRFGRFIILLIPDEKCQLCLMKPHPWGRLSDHYAETLSEILLFKTMPIYHFRRAIPRLFTGMA
jgi:hypothetical protein